MNKKIALFDVDYTILKGDSMWSLLFYGIKKKPLTVLYLPVIFLWVIGYAFKLVSLNKVKEKIFFVVNHLSEDDLETFFKKLVKEKMYPTAKSNLERYRVEGYYILLVTASPHAYMKYFKKYGYADEVMGTVLEYNNGQYRNVIIGENCKSEEKVRRINELLEKNKFKIDYENSVCFSDSNADIPMMKLVNENNRFRVNKKTGNTSEFVF